VRRFTVESVHPNYIGTIVVDRSAFDLHNCPDLAARRSSPRSRAASRSSRSQDWQLIGHTIPNFWRKTIVPVRVGDRVETGVQLLQLWTRTRTAPRKCWCSIRRTATGAPARCRRRT
jgi:hypothetical protein